MRHHLAVLGAVLAALAAPAVAFGEDNAIVRENKRAGTSVWLLKDHADVRPYTADGWRRNKAIEGYCSQASIQAGETLTVYVSTDPASEFQVDFYRLGYYGGKGGRLMLSKGPLAGEPQPTPRDGQNALIECHWRPAITFAIPQNWVSGVYLGKLTALDTKAEAYIVFIVRDNRKADLIFQCSDLTWQSYNRWPAWRSLYDFRGNRWHTSPGDEVGFDRPYATYYNGLPADFAPISNGSGEFLLWEFPLAFWLEKEGYDVTYISNLDTHADPKGLLRAKGFLSVGHDEYWTQEMYDNVSRARDEGVNLAFFSGNSISGRISLKPSTDGRPNRVFGRIDRFRNEMELMGASSHGVGMADWVCETPDHWVYAGTGMKKGDAIPNLIGWEYHGKPVGSAPSLIVLATSPIRGKPNAPAHTGTIYDGSKGNFVFNAGTCWWNMVLSSPPGSVNPPNRDFSKEDPRVQQITRNILDRMIKDK